MESVEYGLVLRQYLILKVADRSTLLRSSLIEKQTLNFNLAEALVL